MGILELQLQAAGVGLFLLAILHLGFPRRFGWKEDLAGVSLVNREVMKVHTWFIGLTVAFLGFLSIALSIDMDHPTFVSRSVLGGMVVFWAIRLVVQLWGFDARLRRETRFNMVVHVMFTVCWGYLTLLYAFALRHQMY